VAERTPDAKAFEWRGAVWTYAEVLRRADAVTEALRKACCGGSNIIVTGTPSPGLVAAMVGVWRVGAVIVPVSQNLPPQRHELLAEEGNARACIVAGDGKVPWSLPVLRVNPRTGELLGDLPAVAQQTETDDAAYVVFTSGTTGKPKGVLGSHQGLAHFLRWQRETFEIGPTDRAAQLTGLAFDVVLRDMFTSLTSGATLCFPPVPTDELDAPALLRWLRSASITMMHSVPSIMDAWLEQWKKEKPLTSLRLLFMAGEPLTDTLVRRCRAQFPSARIINLYGPTETTLAKFYYEVPAEPVSGVQPIGKPLPQTQALILDANGTQCPIGESGEIVIRTPFRTLGYLKSEDPARARFRPNPFNAASPPNDIVYFTGDRGRYRADGALDILGRVDDQVKIRGVRVEPAEIGATLRQHPAIASCFVTAFVDRRGENALCAYYVVTADAADQKPDLRAFLTERLPSAMVPSLFLPLEKMPLGPNGKIDRAALPPPEKPRPVEAAPKGDAAEPASEEEDDVERVVAELWKAVLGLDEIDRHDNFFDLGGHSLNAVQIVHRICETFDIAITVRTIFEAPTVAELSEQVVNAIVQASPDAADEANQE